MILSEAASSSSTPAPGPQPIGRVAVVGGGIAGLASAHFLAAAGARVSLFESSDSFGGLGASFRYGDCDLERFYHCMIPSDRHLLALLESIGIADLVYWRETSFGIHAGDRIYPLNGPADLLRFRALPSADRLRLGLTGLYARLVSSKGLDDLTCEDWLRRLSGDRAFETFWRPMLEAKFGERYHQIPALWFWTRLHREKAGPVERKGYIRGGYRFIADRLVASLQAGGHRLQLQASVDALDLDAAGRPRIRVAGSDWQIFDRLIYTAPLAILSRALADGGSCQVLRDIGQGIDMVGVLNVVLILKRRLTPHYWVAVTDPEIPFQGLVETSNLIDHGDIGGIRVLHLLRYLHRDEPLYSSPDAAVLEAYLGGLRKLFPELNDADIADRFVFRTPFVEPVYCLGYSHKKPPMEPIPGRVYLATSTQVYPDITSWNGSIGLAQGVVARLIEGLSR